MKIEKETWLDNSFYHYYLDSKTNRIIIHGLFNGTNIGYCYHGQRKGFWLRNKIWL